MGKKLSALFCAALLAFGFPGTPASGAEQAEENDIKTVRRTRTVKQETLPAEVKTAVNASGAQLPAAAAPVRVAPAEVERIADKVYRQIEARLRSEKARRGM